MIVSSAEEVPKKLKQTLKKWTEPHTYARGLAISCRDEDCLARNSVHEDTCTCLEVIQMDETILRNQVDDTVSLRNLHSDWEIVDSFGRKVYINSLLGENWVGCLVVNLDNMQLGACCSTNRECEDLCVCRSTLES